MESAGGGASVAVAFEPRRLSFPPAISTFPPDAKKTCAICGHGEETNGAAQADTTSQPAAAAADPHANGAEQQQFIFCRRCLTPAHRECTLHANQSALSSSSSSSSSLGWHCPACSLVVSSDHPASSSSTHELKQPSILPPPPPPADHDIVMVDAVAGGGGGSVCPSTAGGTELFEVERIMKQRITKEGEKQVKRNKENKEMDGTRERELLELTARSTVSSLFVCICFSIS